MARKRQGHMIITIVSIYGLQREGKQMTDNLFIFPWKVLGYKQNIKRRVYPLDFLGLPVSNSTLSLLHLPKKNSNYTDLRASKIGVETYKQKCRKKNKKSKLKPFDNNKIFSRKILFLFF